MEAKARDGPISAEPRSDDAGVDGVGIVDSNVVGDTVPAVLQSPVAHAQAMFGAALVITSTFKAM